MKTKQKLPPIDLKPREEILEIVHESFIPHLPIFALLLLWLILPFFFLFPLFRQGSIGVTVFLVFLFGAMFFLGRKFRAWSKTIMVITDMRVVDISQKGLFDRQVTEATYKRIDEATYRVKGFFSTVFRYGTVRLHLRGSSADIEFAHVSRPARVHDLINDLRGDYEDE